MGEVNGHTAVLVRWLERLLTLPDRTVVVISTVTPAYTLTTPAPFSAADPGSYFGRWRAVFDRWPMAGQRAPHFLRTVQGSLLPRRVTQGNGLFQS